MEAGSEHPLARAIREEAAARGLSLQEVENFVALAGNGVSATVGEHTLLGGSIAFLREHGIEFADAAALADAGKTPVGFALDGKALGVMAIADTVKADSAEAIRELEALGIDVVLLTGDNRRTARAIADTVGIDQVVAEVKPNDKEAIIRHLQQERGVPVAMVGDGINDAVWRSAPVPTWRWMPPMWC